MNQMCKTVANEATGSSERPGLTCQVTHLYASTNDNYTPIMLPHTVLADVNGSFPCPCVFVMHATLHTTPPLLNPYKQSHVPHFLLTEFVLHKQRSIPKHISKDMATVAGGDSRGQPKLPMRHMITVQIQNCILAV